MGWSLFKLLNNVARRKRRGRLTSWIQLFQLLHTTSYLLLSACYSPLTTSHLRPTTGGGGVGKSKQIYDSPTTINQQKGKLPQGEGEGGVKETTHTTTTPATNTDLPNGGYSYTHTKHA